LENKKHYVTKIKKSRNDQRHGESDKKFAISGFCEFSRLKLRRDLRDKGVDYKVGRKTLLKRALLGKAKGEVPELSGEVAIAYSTDQTASSREIYNFQKTHKGILEIIGGIFEGNFLGKEKMMEIAMIPSREVLYAQFVNLINSPIQRFAVVLDQIAKGKNKVS
jgi:large subunit ribosomal protein L10